MFNLVIGYLMVFFSSAASLFLGYCFNGESCKDVYKTILIEAVGIVSAVFLLEYIGINNNIWFPAITAGIMASHWKKGIWQGSVLAYLIASSYYYLTVLIYQFGKMYFNGYWYIMIVINLFCILCVAILRKKLLPNNWSEYFLNQKTDSKNSVINIGVLYSFMLIILAWNYFIANFFNNINRNTVFIILLFSIMFFASALYSIRIMVYYKSEKIEALIDKQYQQELQGFINIIRSQRHDYNFHVHALAGLIKSEKYKECQEYLGSIVNDTNTMNELLPVKDPAVSSIINNFRGTALQKGIKMYINISDDLGRVITTVYETNRIIGNLLQNAIDEVENHKDRSYGIHLRIFKRGGYCVIDVSNKITDAEKLINAFRYGYSSKEEHEGIGLNSISRIAKKYGGIVYTSLEGDVIHFIAKIPNKILRQGELNGYP